MNTTLVVPTLTSSVRSLLGETEPFTVRAETAQVEVLYIGGEAKQRMPRVVVDMLKEYIVRSTMFRLSNLRVNRATDRKRSQIRVAPSFPSLKSLFGTGCKDKSLLAKVSHALPDEKQNQTSESRSCQSSAAGWQGHREAHDAVHCLGASAAFGFRRLATSAAKASQLASTAPGEPVDQKLAEDLVLSLQPRELPQVLQPFAAAAFMPPELWTGLAPEVPKCMEQLTEMQLESTGTTGTVHESLSQVVAIDRQLLLRAEAAMHRAVSAAALFLRFRLAAAEGDREVHHDPFPRLVPLKPFGGLLELHEATSDVPRLLGAELLEPLAELGYVHVALLMSSLQLREPSELLHEVAALLEARANELPPPGRLVGAVVALSQLGPWPQEPPPGGPLIAALETSLPTLPASQLSGVALSCATLQHEAPLFWQQVHGFLLSKISELTGRHLADIFLALATHQMCPELHGLALPRLVEKLAPDEALSIAWALAALRFSGSGLLPQLLQIAQSAELTPAEATQVQQIILSLEQDVSAKALDRPKPWLQEEKHQGQAMARIGCHGSCSSLASECSSRFAQEALGELCPPLEEAGVRFSLDEVLEEFYHLDLAIEGQRALVLDSVTRATAEAPWSPWITLKCRHLRHLGWEVHWLPLRRWEHMSPEERDELSSSLLGKKLLARSSESAIELHGLALPRLLEHLAPDEALSIAWALALRFSGSGHLPQLLQMAQTTELAPTKATQVQQIDLKPGEVVWRAPPLAAILHERYRGDRCDRCFSKGDPADGAEKCSMDDTWLSRQLLEMESLSAIYCEEGDLRVDEEALEALGAAAKDVEASLSRLPALSLSVRVFTDDAVAAGSVRLAAVLPHGYPTTAAPMVWLEPEVEASTSSRFLQVADDDHLGQRLQEAALHWGQKGEECLLPLIQTAEELTSSRSDDLAVAMAVQEELEEQEEVPTLAPPCTRVLRARGALGRRAMIKDWAAQLQLGGMAKVGWPGVIIVEGEEPNVVAYVEALSRLRWKHFVVRAEQMIELDGMPLDSLRVLPVPLEEFPPDGMLGRRAGTERAHL
eukprot:g21809.t1